MATELLSISFKILSVKATPLFQSILLQNVFNHGPKSRLQRFQSGG